MSLTPLFTLPAHIQIHAIAAMLALLLGVVQIVLPKGTLSHKVIGVMWVVLMIAVVATSAFIGNKLGPSDPLFGRFGFIHLFTVLGIYSITMGVLLIVRGGPSLKGHANSFVGLFVGGLIIAGALAFLPGRTLHNVVFGG